MPQQRATAAGRIHRVVQHPASLPGIEAVTLASNHSFPRHAHDQLGVGVLLAGGQRSWSGVGQVESGCGDAIMVNPGEMHDGAPVDGAVRVWRMLYLEPALLGGAAEIVRPTVRDPLLSERFAAAFAGVTEPQAERLAAEEALLRLLAYVWRRHGQRASVRLPPPPGIGRALARLDEAPQAPVTLAELAGLAGLGRFQLLRGFARHVGITPHAYLVQRRVRLARRLLAGRVPIAEAALAAGFADQSHLTRAFLRQFGTTPGRYVAALG